MTSALYCACALALVSVVKLLLQPQGALGEELQLLQVPEPRGAEWLKNFGQFNKYVEKLFNGGWKSKDSKKSKDNENSKKPLNATKSPPPDAEKPQALTHSLGPSPGVPKADPVLS